LRTLGADNILQPAQVLAEDVAVQKEQRIERLILCRCAHLLVNRQRREKPSDLVLAYLQRLALAMEEDKPLDPTDLGLLCPDAVVSHRDRLPDLIEQFGLLACGSARDHGSTLD
jgi:hypothetical protein